MSEKFRRGSPNVVHQSSRFTVVEGPVAGPDGEIHRRQWIEHPGAVVILPILPGDQICLIRNGRFAVEETLIELPAGTLTPGEDPLGAARRELSEETGYRCGSIEKLHEFYVSPGVLAEKMHLYVATELEPGRPQLDAGEIIEPLVVPIAEAIRMGVEGEIRDAKSLVGLLLYDARIR